MFVVTADQRGSRSEGDRVPDVLARLARVAVLRPFERTVGDEVQAVVDDAATALDAALVLVRDGHWSVGLGAGAVREPLPASTREGAGPAFELARDAVQRAKSATPRVAVSGADAGAAGQAEAVLRLLADLVARRTPQGWEVVDLLGSGANQAEAAQRLGITRQAVSQRARAAAWQHERDVRPVVVGLLERAQGAS